MAGSAVPEFGAEPPKAIREIYTSFVADPEMLGMLLEERPAVVSFHFGLPPRATIAALKNAGIVLIATATHLHEAEAIENAGIDAIVAQGSRPADIAACSIQPWTMGWVPSR